MATPPAFTLNLGTGSLCFQLNSAQELCVTLPGGVRICVQTDLDTGDPAKVSRAFLAQVSTALGPLAPFFILLEFAQAVVECMKAVQSLNPIKIGKCIPKLLEALQKLVALAPQLTVPRMAKGIILAIREALLGLKLELAAVIAAETRLLAAATLAAKPGNAELQHVVDCASANLQADLANLSASMGPLNQIAGYVNLLLDIAQVPGDLRIPSFEELGPSAADALIPLDVAVAALGILADAIPLPP